MKLNDCAQQLQMDVQMQMNVVTLEVTLSDHALQNHLMAWWWWWLLLLFVFFWCVGAARDGKLELASWERAGVKA